MAFENCFTCDPMREYLNQASGYAGKMAIALHDPMALLFAAFAGLWITISGYKMFMGKFSKPDFGIECFFIIVASILLMGNSSIITSIYTVALQIMGGAGSVAFSAGSNHLPAGAGGNDLDSFLVLMQAAENGIRSILNTAEVLAKDTSFYDVPRWILIGLLIFPYILLIYAFFAQTVIAVFRVMVIATLSPFLSMALAFGWGRGMALTGFKSVISAVMVLFASCLAIGVIIYGVNSLELGGDAGAGVIGKNSIDFTNKKLLVAIALGWLGTAFQAEATGIANSIVGSHWSNTGVGIITAGLGGSTLAAGGAAFGVGKKLLGVGGSAAAAGAGFLAGKYLGGANSSGSVANNLIQDMAKVKGFVSGGFSGGFKSS